MFQLRCTKQLSWEILMSSLNQHDTVKTTFLQLFCIFDRTKSTVSYYSMPTTMIWLSQSDSGCFCCPKNLNKFLGWHWLFTFIQLKVQNNLWACICKILTLFPTGFSFYMILILSRRFLWNDSMILSSNVMQDPGAKAFWNWSFNAAASSKSCCSLFSFSDNFKYFKMFPNLLMLIILPNFMEENKVCLLSDQCRHPEPWTS